MDALVAAMQARPFTATIVAGVVALVLQFLYKGYRQRAYFRNLVSLLTEKTCWDLTFDTERSLVLLTVGFWVISRSWARWQP
jgi:hypothetical protein